MGKECMGHSGVLQTEGLVVWWITPKSASRKDAISIGNAYGYDRSDRRRIERMRPRLVSASDRELYLTMTYLRVLSRI